MNKTKSPGIYWRQQVETRPTDFHNVVIQSTEHCHALFQLYLYFKNDHFISFCSSSTSLSYEMLTKPVQVYDCTTKHEKAEGVWILLQSDVNNLLLKFYLFFFYRIVSTVSHARASSIIWQSEFVCVCCSVIHSGDYYLFESDSEDEEDLNYEEKKPQAQTACQVRTQHSSS